MATNLMVTPLYPNEPAERMITRFFKKYRESDIYDLYKQKTFYEKPSVKKHRRRRKAQHVNDI
jgi:ribosomal protein S21